MLFKSWLYYLENPDRKESEAVQVRYMFRTDHFSKDFHLQSAVSVWGPRTHKANCINSYTDPVPNLIHMNSSHLYRHAVTWAGSFSSLFSLRLKHCRVKSSSRGLMQLVSVGLGNSTKGLWSEFLYLPSTGSMRESGCEAQRAGNNRQQNQKEKKIC